MLCSLPLLSPSEREAIRLARGCFNCRKTPADAGWTQHTSKNCPGDASRGIPPRSATVAVVVPHYDDEFDSDDDAPSSEDYDTDQLNDLAHR